MTTLNIFKRDDNAVTFAAGATILNEGDEGHEFYVVLEGEVDIIHKGQLLYSVGPGGLFGEMALIDASPRSADVIAKSDCKLAVVNERRFLYLVQETPFFALTVMKIMAARLRVLGDQASAAARG